MNRKNNNKYFDVVLLKKLIYIQIYDIIYNI